VGINSNPVVARPPNSGFGSPIASESLPSSSVSPVPSDSLGPSGDWNTFLGAPKNPVVNPAAVAPPQAPVGRLVAPGVQIQDDPYFIPIPDKDLKVAPYDAKVFADFCDDDLLAAIRDIAAPTREIHYTGARKAMFSDIDNIHGKVDCIYTSRNVETFEIPEAIGENGMNTEHTWPVSHGIRDTRGRADIHHLFPSHAKANVKRSSFPFGIVEHVHWEMDGSKLGSNKAGEKVFEPAPESRGNIARAMFYVSTVYDLKIPSEEEAVLKLWHQEDPVDGGELHRNGEIAAYQGNRNPFVDDESLVRRIEDF
jgi:deoxyribonuclease-1